MNLRRILKDVPLDIQVLDDNLRVLQTEVHSVLIFLEVGTAIPTVRFLAIRDGIEMTRVQLVEVAVDQRDCRVLCSMT